MISKDIIDYIKTQIDKGQSKEDVKKALVSAGWQQMDIDEAFKYAESGIPLAPVPGNAQYSGQTDQASQNTQFLASPTDLLKEAWEIYRSRIKIFAGIILVPVMAIIAGILAAILIVPSLFVLFTVGAFDNFSILSFFSNLGLVFAILFIIIAIVVIIQIWSQAALLYVIKDYNENIGFWKHTNEAGIRLV